MRIATAVLAAAVALALATAGAPARSPHVFRVGPGGTNKTIQSAIDQAKPGDWVLVRPGDYRGTVRINKPNIHLRGTNRNKVIIDGTKSGRPCSSRAKDQNFHRGSKGNGIEIHANGVSVENLTVCNFLGEGNQIWWNGGDGSGKIGMSTWNGSFLTATSTFFDRKKPKAYYGIFISNARGPGELSDSYGSNMADSAFYVGACHPCNAKLDHLHAQHNLDGYSGTNSSKVLVQDSEFNDNTQGLTTNSQNNDDQPSPQLGSSFIGNYIHDNNNPNTPSTKDSLRAVGTGVVVTGGRNNRVTGNRIEHNGAWGILVVPFIDVGKPPKIAHCRGGTATKNKDGTTTCFFDVFNNEISGNALQSDGFFGNPTNGDLADVSGQNAKANCWHDNTHADGSAVTAEPSDLQTAHATCGRPGHGDDLTSELALQGLCDTELLAKCAADATHQYPRQTKVRLIKLPRLKTMPDPCTGVPGDQWCPPKR